MARTHKSRFVADKIIREKDDGDFVDNGPAKRYRCKPHRARFSIQGEGARDRDRCRSFPPSIHGDPYRPVRYVSTDVYNVFLYIYIYIYLYQFVRSDPFPGHAMVGRLTPEVVPTRYCLSCISVPSHRLALICELPIASLKNESNSIRVNSLIFPISPIFKILCIYLPILVVDRF